MQVLRSERISKRHSVEYGVATWDSKSMSLRNRWDTDAGKFSPHASAEILAKDLMLLFRKALEWGCFDTSLDQLLILISRRVHGPSR